MEGRQRRSFTDTTSGKRLIWWLRAAARSGRWPRNLACAIPVAALGGATWGWAGADGGGAAPHNAATLPSADHAAEIARLQRENERLRMERDILKKSIAIFAGTRTSDSASSKIAAPTIQ